MSDTLKVAIIVALGVIAAVALYLYYSPYQQCVRAQVEQSREMQGADFDDTFARNAARVSCAH